MSAKLAYAKQLAESMSSTLRFTTAKQAGETVHMADDIEAFAFHALSWECRMRCFKWMSPDDEESANELLLRLLSWKKARLQWWLYWKRKCLPQLATPIPQTRKRAIEAADMIRRRQIGPAAKEFLDALASGSVSQADHDHFLKCCASLKPAKWARPPFDAWLICIWPIVEAYTWTPYQTWLVAVEKFDSVDAYTKFLDTSDGLEKQCAKLELRFVPSKAGRPSLALERALPKMADLALRIDATWPLLEMEQEIGK